MKKSLILLITLIGSVGCSTPRYTPNVVQTEYKEIQVPIPCVESMPVKPYYYKETPNTAGDLAAYYAEVETLLLKCIKRKDKK